MKKQLVVVSALALFAAAGFVVAQQQDATPDPMKAWIKANMPGSNHAFLLGNMLGEWNATSSLWLQPGAQPTITQGTSVCTPEMTGRFVQMRHEGEMAGMPFRGLGYFGYNNTTQQFENVWMDSGSTGLLMSTGTKSDNTITWNASTTCAITKQPKTSKSITRFEGRDRMVIEMYETWTDGSEFKTMEVVYTRKPVDQTRFENSKGQPQSSLPTNPNATGKLINTQKREWNQPALSNADTQIPGEGE